MGAGGRRGEGRRGGPVLPLWARASRGERLSACLGHRPALRARRRSRLPATGSPRGAQHPFRSLPFSKTRRLRGAPERLSAPLPDPAASLPGGFTSWVRSPGVAPGTAAAKKVALPSLLSDDHLRLVPMKFQPKWPVAQVYLRLAGHQPRLGGGELVERGSLVRVAVLLWVGVAGRGVSLGRRVGQQAVVGSVGDDRVVGHVAAGAADGEGGMRRSVLAGVREHGTGSGGRRLWLAGLREEVAICSRAIETVTKLRDPVQDRREFTSLDVPW